MAIRRRDIPRIFIERLEASHPEPAKFEADEVEEWPPDVVEQLRADGLLKPFGRATSVECDGCDWRCRKPVVVRQRPAGLGLQAFVLCDEEPDFGRISVPLERLAQFRTTLAALSGLVASFLDLGPLRPSTNGGSFSLGTIKGRHGFRQVSLSLQDGQLRLGVGKQFEQAVGLMRWTKAGLSIDRDHILRLANRKETARPSTKTYQPDRTKQRQRARKTQARDNRIFREAKRLHAAGERSWTAIAEVIAAMESMKKKHARMPSAARVRRMITEKLKSERQNFRSNRK